MTDKSKKNETVARVVKKAHVDIDGDELVIRIPMSNPPVPSETGKTLLVASTRGAYETDMLVMDQSLIVNVNAYIYATPKGATKKAA